MNSDKNDLSSFLGLASRNRPIQSSGVKNLGSNPRISCHFKSLKLKEKMALSDLQIVSFWAEKNARTIEVKRLGIEFSGVTKRLITSALIFSHPELKDWPTVSR